MRNLIPLLWLWASAALAAEPAKDAPLDTQFLRDYSETRGFMLGRPVQAKPTPDGKAVLFLRSEARKARLSLYEFDVAIAKTRELLTPETLLKGAEETLSAEEKARRERMRVSVGGFSSYQLSEDGSLILLSLSGKLYIYDRATAKVRELKTGPGVLLDPKFSPDGKMVSYVREYDVHIYDLASDKEHRLTTGGTEKKPHGLAEFVAQEEMSRFSGYWWSPDSKFIAYEEYDADGVEVWFVADPVHPEQAPLPSFYPRPGKKNVTVRLGVVPVGGGETVWVQWDREKNEYLASVRWDKHGPLTIQVQDRKQQNLRLLLVNPTMGQTTPLLQEKDAAFLNLHPDMPRWFQDGQRFLWVSQAGGSLNLEVRHADSKLPPETTRTPREFRQFAGAKLDGKSPAYFFLGDHEPTKMRLWICNDGLRPAEELSRTFGVAGPAGVQSAVFSQDGALLVLTATTATAMPRTTIHREWIAANGFDTKPLAELASVAEEPPFKPNITFEKVGDEPGFYTAIVRPRHFDPKKKYPVLVDVYGGPHHQTVVEAMRSWLLPQWLADQGFIVVGIDNRGTPGRGRDWERAIYQKFGSVPLEDQVAGLQALGKKFPELDLSRVGIYGWSFGGYMSALAVLKRPDVFKAAVAGAPVTDWEDYDTHYTERYLGLPKDNRDAYKEASLLTHADKLERPLLLVHGTADDNVYFRHSLRLADALFRAGKDFEILPLPGLTHMVPDPVIMERMYTRIARHFQTHLGEPK